MNRTALGWAVALSAACAAVLLLAQAPVLLRRVDAFRVEQVEVVGTRYLAPHAALEASGIGTDASVFDDPDPWRQALLRHPMIKEATIERRLPNTLVVRVVEVEPVALVRTPELLPVDSSGRVLPIDPTSAVLDLPVLDATSAIGEDGRLADPRAVAAIVVAARLRRLDPDLAARVSELVPMADGGLRLLLREPSRAEVLLPPGLDEVRLEQLRLTIADLEARGELPVVHRIDARFREQVVVSLIPDANG